MLSHYFVWKDALEKGYKNIMIFEDDAALEKDYVENLAVAWDELSAVPEWDLLYIGRSNLNVTVPERPVRNTLKWVWPNYSAWTLNYILSESGNLRVFQVLFGQ